MARLDRDSGRPVETVGVHPNVYYQQGGKYFDANDREITEAQAYAIHDRNIIARPPGPNTLTLHRKGTNGHA